MHLPCISPPSLFPHDPRTGERWPDAFIEKCVSYCWLAHVSGRQTIPSPGKVRTHRIESIASKLRRPEATVGQLPACSSGPLVGCSGSNSVYTSIMGGVPLVRPISHRGLVDAAFATTPLNASMQRQRDFRSSGGVYRLLQAEHRVPWNAHRGLAAEHHAVLPCSHR